MVLETSNVYWLDEGSGAGQASRHKKAR